MALVFSGQHGSFAYNIYEEASESYIKIIGFDSLEKDPIIPPYIKNIPVKIIGNSVFRYKDIVSVELPNTLTEIDDYAFQGCIGLKEIEFPDSIREVGQGVCSWCDNLEKVKWSSLAFIIPKDAFCSCHSLKTVSNIEHVKTIESNAFRKTGLNFFKIPKSVLKISGCSFAECDDLKLIKMTHLPYIDKKAFMDSNNVKIMCGANHYVAEWAKLCNIPIYESKLDEFLNSIVCDNEKEGEK